jgi:hypothetical protein
MSTFRNEKSVVEIPRNIRSTSFTPLYILRLWGISVEPKAGNDHLYLATLPPGFEIISIPGRTDQFRIVNAEGEAIAEYTTKDKPLVHVIPPGKFKRYSSPVCAV